MKKTALNLSAALFAGALIFTASCKKEPIVVTADKTSAAIGEEITFSCIATEGSVKKSFITWDFGDGNATVNQSAAAEIYDNNNLVTVSYSFNAAGTYTVSAIFNKSGNPTKKNATSTYGNVTVTIASIAPTFTIMDAAGNGVSSVMVAQELSFSNTSSITDKPQANINYTWYDNNVAFDNTKTPGNRQMNTAGKHTFKLQLIQGGTITWSSGVDIIVGGQSLSNEELQAMIGGKWNVVSTTPTFTGAAYTNTNTPCFATSTPTYNKLYSTIYLDDNGDADWGIVAFPTYNAGNMVPSPGVSITVASATSVFVNGIASWGGKGSENGLYTTTVSGSSMTLTRIENGDNTGSGSCTYTDTFTIVLSR